MSETREIKIKVNDKWVTGTVKSGTTLLRFLRDNGFTEVKKGCGEGECGTCTVLLDNKAVTTCLILALQANGREVLTIEGLAHGSELHPIQEAFIEHLGFQCGFCAPGMIMSTKALLDENPKPTEDEAKRAIWGNLCRCTGYVKIVESILAAAQKM